MSLKNPLAIILKMLPYFNLMDVMLHRIMLVIVVQIKGQEGQRVDISMCNPRVHVE